MESGAAHMLQPRHSPWFEACQREINFLHYFDLFRCTIGYWYVQARLVHEPSSVETGFFNLNSNSGECFYFTSCDRLIRLMTPNNRFCKQQSADNSLSRGKPREVR